MTAQRIENDEENRIHAIVRGRGGRLTVPTRLIISILGSSSEHLTAEDLIAEVEQRMVGIAPSTVYRVIQRLGELGIVEHVHSGNGPAFYHLREHGHAHLVCYSCGVIIDLPGALIEDLARAALRDYHFTLDPHHAALLGRCEDCAVAAGPSAFGAVP